MTLGLLLGSELAWAVSLWALWRRLRRDRTDLRDAISGSRRVQMVGWLVCPECGRGIWTQLPPSLPPVR